MIGVVVALNGAAAAERKRRNIRGWRLTHVRVRGVIAARVISTQLRVRVGLDVITTAWRLQEHFYVTTTLGLVLCMNQRTAK